MALSPGIGRVSRPLEEGASCLYSSSTFKMSFIAHISKLSARQLGYRV
jgi:hypothetical protein